MMREYGVWSIEYRERQHSKGAAEGDRMIGRGVRPARPRTTEPVVPTLRGGAARSKQFAMESGKKQRPAKDGQPYPAPPPILHTRYSILSSRPLFVPLHF